MTMIFNRPCSAQRDFSIKNVFRIFFRIGHRRVFGSCDLYSIWSTFSVLDDKIQSACSVINIPAWFKGVIFVLHQMLCGIFFIAKYSLSTVYILSLLTHWEMTQNNWILSYSNVLMENHLSESSVRFLLMSIVLHIYTVQYPVTCTSVLKIMHAYLISPPSSLLCCRCQIGRRDIILICLAMRYAQVIQMASFYSVTCVGVARECVIVYDKVTWLRIFTHRSSHACCITNEHCAPLHVYSICIHILYNTDLLHARTRNNIARTSHLQDCGTRILHNHVVHN